MPSVLDIRTPPDVSALLGRLSSKQLRQANFQVVKRTTAQIVKLIRAEVRDQTTISKKYVDRVITQTDPKGDPPVGKVNVKRQMIPLSAYKATASKAAGVSVKVAKGLPPIRLRHAFMAIVGTGEHRGIFLRSTHLPTKGPNAGGIEQRISKSGRPFQTKIRLTPDGFAGRLSIKQQFGPPIVNIVSIPEVLGRIVFNADAFMRKQAESQVFRFTGVNPASASPETP